MLKQDNIELVLEEKAQIEAKLLELTKNPEKVVDNKLKELDDVIKTLPDRKPIKRENISMKQYLESIKKNIADNPKQYVQNLINEYTIRKRTIEEQLSKLEKEK